MTKSSECPGMCSEDKQGDLKIQAGGTSGWEPMKEAETAH